MTLHLWSAIKRHSESLFQGWIVLQKECLLVSMMDELVKWKFVQLIRHLLLYFPLTAVCIFLCQEALDKEWNSHPSKFNGNFTIDLNDTEIWYRISKALYKKQKKMD